MDGIVSENSEQIQTVVAWLPGTDVAEALAALDAAEREFDRVKKIVTNAKKNLASAMRS